MQKKVKGREAVKKQHGHRRTIERWTSTEKRKMWKEKKQQSQWVRVWRKRRKKASEHGAACHWPPGVNNPSQIDLPAWPSRAFWINLKLISMPEVGKTSSGAYQKYSGAGRIWQGNLSHCTTGNGLWAPRAQRGRACSLYAHKSPPTDSVSLHAPGTAQRSHMLPIVQHSSQRVCGALTYTHRPASAPHRCQYTPTGYPKKKNSKSVRAQYVNTF